MVRKTRTPKTQDSNEEERPDDLALAERGLNHRIGSVQEAAEYFLQGRPVQDVSRVALRQAAVKFLGWRSRDLRSFPVLERYVTKCTVPELRELIAEVVIAQEIEAALSGQPTSDETLRRWARYPTWRLPSEAATLFSGGEPGAFSLDRSRSDKNRAYNDLLERFERAVEIGDLKPSSRPASVVAWAKRNKIAVPTPIENELSGDLPTEDSGVGEEIKSLRMRKNIGIMVLGMAKAKYGYDPKKAKQSAAKEISKAMVINRQATLSAERVNEHLREFVTVADLWDKWDGLGEG